MCFDSLVFTMSGTEASCHQFPCLFCWGSLCIFGLACFAYAKQALSPSCPLALLCSWYLKISQDTKLPETSFLSVLILLHILPRVALLLQVAFVDQSGVFQPGAWVVRKPCCLSCLVHGGFH